MGQTYVVKIVYQLKKDKAMRAMNYFSTNPTIMGIPIRAHTVLVLSEEELFANRGELGMLLDGGVIDIQTQDGETFRFSKDMTHVIPAEDEEYSAKVLESQKGLDTELNSEIDAAFSEEKDKSLVANIDSLQIPDDLLVESPEEIQGPPQDSATSSNNVEIPPELFSEDLRENAESDRFFSEVKKYVGSRRKTMKVPQKKATRGHK